MRGPELKGLCLFLFALLLPPALQAQGAVPVFHYTAGRHAYTFAGKSPARGGTTKISTVLVPVTITFPHRGNSVPVVLHASPDVRAVLHSPVFANFQYPSGGDTQYADALLRSTVPHASSWHTMLEQPQIVPVTVSIPPADGYTLYSRSTGRRMAVVDLKFLARAVLRQLPPVHGRLVIAFTHNTTYYADHDATICCSWGTHGVDPKTGDSFVLSTYLHHAPAILKDHDIQPLTQQIAEFVYDPHHNPFYPGRFSTQPGNHFPAWRRSATGWCAGEGAGSNYFQLEPTDTNLKNDFPASLGFGLRSGSHTYHVENVPLLAWYVNAHKLRPPYSFPNPGALSAPATPCTSHAKQPSVSAAGQPVALPGKTPRPSAHWLVGYWVPRAPNGKRLPLRDVSPQWNVVIVSFAPPAPHAPEGDLHYVPPRGVSPAQFKAEIDFLKRRGQKVMISLGGGGQFVRLEKPSAVREFVQSVEKIVTRWGFQGIDMDFETPSLEIAPGDSDFRHPTTPSILHLIAALKQLHRHFGPKFMISLVPEGTQVPAGFDTYGGQFGSYLPIVHALRNILTFVDVQEYNTPPLEGLDGEIYQVHTVGYYAAMTELLLHGFPVAGNPGEYFRGLPADKVVTGYLVNYADPGRVSQSLHYLISGHRPADTRYRLRKPGGYPHFRGAMFWNIDGDWVDHSKYSNLIGPQLHGKHP